MKDQVEPNESALRRVLREGISSDERTLESDGYRITVGPLTPHSDGDKLHFPEWMTVEIPGFSEPDMFVRIELRNHAPRIVETSLRASATSREIRPSDFRGADLESFIRLYEGFIVEVEYEIDEAGERIVISAAVNLEGEVFDYIHKAVEQRRSTKRIINTAFLRQVATVYRDNIEHAPTSAVSRAFGVKHRQATDYVKQARDRGLLPPTQQGKAKA